MAQWIKDLTLVRELKGLRSTLSGGLYRAEYFLWRIIVIFLFKLRKQRFKSRLPLNAVERLMFEQ